MICTGCGAPSAPNDQVCGGCGRDAQRSAFQLGQAMREQTPRATREGWCWSALWIPSALGFVLVGIIFLLCA